jgi:hypothetical protein
MNSLQMKLGSFSENSNAATLALSIKGSERVGTESAEGPAVGGAAVGGPAAGGPATGGWSGQGLGAGCLPRFKMGGASEQGGACDCVAGGDAEGADCDGCDCGEDA